MVGENPLGSAVTQDGHYLLVTNDDERNVGASNDNPAYTDNQANGHGAVPGGYVLSVIRTSDMTVTDQKFVPARAAASVSRRLQTGLPVAPSTAVGQTQSDANSALFLGVTVEGKLRDANLQGRAPGFRRALPPQLVDQPIGRDDLVRAQ
jgi:hypothetical protein